MFRSPDDFQVVPYHFGDFLEIPRRKQTYAGPMQDLWSSVFRVDGPELQVTGPNCEPRTNDLLVKAQQMRAVPQSLVPENGWIFENCQTTGVNGVTKMVRHVNLGLQKKLLRSTAQHLNLHF